MCTGEAAGIAMGLVMVGTRSSSAIGDLLTVSIHTVTLWNQRSCDDVSLL